MKKRTKRSRKFNPVSAGKPQPLWMPGDGLPFPKIKRKSSLRRQP